MKKILIFAICVLFLPSQGQFGRLSAQVYAQMKLWDRKYRYPKVNSVEFQGDVPSLSMYDAIYGHGAMWENEWIGFRVYMDHRQSIDLYGKKTAQMELDSINFYSTPELMQKGFGEDILFVGPSIGAGSFRGYVSESEKGEVRSEKNGELTFVNPVKARGQRVLQEGPDTAIVEIYATDWQYQGKTLQFCQRFTAIRGHRDILVDVDIEAKGEGLKAKVVDSLFFATGAQKLERDNEGFADPCGLVASWGANVPDKGNYPDLVERLGIAVRVSPENLVEVREDSLNYLCLVRPVNGHIRYWLAAASDMQQEGEAFHNGRDWFQWVRNNLTKISDK